MASILQQVRRLKLWLVLIGLCFFIQWLGWQEVLRFDRSHVLQGEVWRLITAHLTHLNWSHFLLNIAGLLIVAIFFSRYKGNYYWCSALVLLALATSAGLMLDGQLEYYVGFSGVLHGLFIIGGYWEFRHYRLSGGVLLLLMLVKLVWEQVFGALPGSESMVGGLVAVNAHLYGALAGLAYLVVDRALLVRAGLRPE